jgi:hypothetical protein
MKTTQPTLHVQKEQRTSAPAIITAAPLSDRLREDTPAPKLSQAVETMKRIFTESRARTTDDFFEQDYQGMLAKIGDLAYTAQDVTSFSEQLALFQKEGDFSFRAGLLLSALINHSQGEKFTINTYRLSTPVSVLGYHNTKDIVVNGGLGDGTAIMMESGSMLVKGNVGEMLCDRMTGGTVRVTGYAGNWAADAMDGGELFFKGPYCNLSSLLKSGRVHILDEES